MRSYSVTGLDHSGADAGASTDAANAVVDVDEQEFEDARELLARRVKGATLDGRRGCNNINNINNINNNVNNVNDNDNNNHNDINNRNHNIHRIHDGMHAAEIHARLSPEGSVDTQLTG